MLARICTFGSHSHSHSFFLFLVCVLLSIAVVAGWSRGALQGVTRLALTATAMQAQTVANMAALAVIPAQTGT